MVSQVLRLDCLPEEHGATCESFPQRGGSQRDADSHAPFCRCKASKGKLAAGSLTDGCLLQGTPPRPLRYPRGSRGTEASDGRLPRVLSSPAQCSSLSSSEVVTEPPAIGAASLQRTACKTASCFLIFPITLPYRANSLKSQLASLLLLVVLVISL